jgi:OOP family OmpA-OmpF porin
VSRQKIIFLSGTAIVNEATRGSVGKVAALLRTCPAARVEIAGHTDNLGDPATSMPLSQRRADAVKAALVRLGLPAGRMISRGYGELQPLASNKTAAGRIANRRVEIRVP